ncbi:hypothetical protein HK096_010154, partial [Nowakowskiella sp. JEL0078]
MTPLNTTGSWIVENTSDRNALNIHQVPLKTKLTPGTALLRHLTSLIGPSDSRVVSGIYYLKDKPPFTAGYTFIAVVEDVVLPTKDFPEGCPIVKKGDIVAAMTRINGWQKYSIYDITDPKYNLVVVPFSITPFDPNGISILEVSSLVLNSATAYGMVHHSNTPLKAGDSVLVLSAAGTVGATLCQLLRHEFPEVTVYGTCSREKTEFVESLGAIAIDYKTKDFVVETSRLTGGKGLAAVYDGVGELDRSWKALSPTGRLVIFGFSLETKTPPFLTIAKVLTKGALPCGRSSYFYGISQHRESDPNKYTADMNVLFDYLQKRIVVPKIDRIFGFEDAKLGLEYYESGK